MSTLFDEEGERILSATNDVRSIGKIKFGNKCGINYASTAYIVGGRVALLLLEALPSSLNAEEEADSAIAKLLDDDHILKMPRGSIP